MPARISRAGSSWGSKAITFAILSMVTGLVQAQSASAPATTATSTSVDPGTESLARFISNDGLLLLFESSGLNEHDAAWRESNLYKLLAETPLGATLELVSAQLIDQFFAADATKKVTGAEVVSLIKHVARNGWVLGINSVEKGARPYRVTLVFKGATSKAMRPVTSRLLGAAMGDIRPRLVRKENRTIIAVDIPAPPAPQPTSSATPGASAKTAPSAPPPPAPVNWIWWPEQDDLFIGLFPGDDGASMLNTINGKSPSAAKLPSISEARAAEGGFRPIATRFIDFAALSSIEGGDWLINLLKKGKELTGASRVVQSLGVENQALVTRTRLISPKPYTSFASLFQAPAFKKSSLIPMPDAVRSFATFSIQADRLPGLIDHFDAGGELKMKLEEFKQSLNESNRIDLEKDLLARIGPKMTLYLSPVRLAATEDEPLSMQSLFSNGLDLKSLMAMSKPFLAEATFVAEVKNPVEFGKALDGFIIALNRELKARATEFEEKENEKAEEVRGPGRRDDQDPARSRRGGGGGSGDRSKNRRPPEILAPKFNPLSNVATIHRFQLATPSAAKYRLGPPQFRPVIYMDGKYLVIAASATTAEVAIEALAVKDWKPTQEIEKALMNIPDEVVSLAVIDSRETTSSLLSSLPGTLQAHINAGIALSKARIPSGAAAIPAAAPAGGGSVNTPRGRDEEFRPRGKDVAEFNGQLRFGAAMTPPGAYSPPSAPAAAARPAQVISQTIQFRVLPEQLPKAEDIITLLFPTTFSITTDEKGILVSRRSALPEPIGLETNATALGIIMPIVQAARASVLTTTPPANAQPNAGAPNNSPAFQPPGGPRGGRRGRDDL